MQHKQTTKINLLGYTATRVANLVVCSGGFLAS